MRLFLLHSILFLTAGSGFAQQSEYLVPKEASTVLCINNVNLLQKIALDDLIKYEFMEEVQQELFDGSTSGKSLRDTGIDFDQKLCVFSGSNDQFELTGFSFGLADKKQLFDVFDDYTPIESSYPGIELYESYFNRIAIKGNSGVLFRITPQMGVVDGMTDSIWYARGNDYPWLEGDLGVLLEELKSSDEGSITNEMETIENTSNPDDINDYPVADDNPNVKNYYELRDSVELVLHERIQSEFCNELFVKQTNLIVRSAAFQEQIAHNTEGIFYADLAKGGGNHAGLRYMNLLYPSIYTDIEKLYEGSLLLGDLFIRDTEVELKLSARYNPELGSIYQELSDSKFDAQIANYISDESHAFFTYTVNLQQAYEQALKIITPILETSEDQRLLVDLFLIELLDEYVNKEKVFSTYKGSMFGSYHGIKKIPTRKIEFVYDEETFEYIERAVEAEEDMPLFTLGVSTDQTELLDKMLGRLSRIYPQISKSENFWSIENAVLNAAPLFILNVKGLLIFTNDVELATRYPNGYGKQKLNSTRLAKAKKGGMVYAAVDLGKSIESLPRGLFNDHENEVIDIMRGKHGSIELSTTKTSISETGFNLKYDFAGNPDDKGTYILDLINSLYVISK